MLSDSEISMFSLTSDKNIAKNQYVFGAYFLVCFPQTSSEGSHFPTLPVAGLNAYLLAVSRREKIFERAR